MSAGYREDPEASGPSTRPADPGAVRESTAGSLGSLRRASLLGTLGTLATIFLYGGSDPAAIPAQLKNGIVAGLSVAEAIAVVAFAALPRRLAREGGFGALLRGLIGEPGGGTLDHELACAYLLYGLKCTLQLCSLLAALMFAVLLFRLSRATWTLANLGMILLLIGYQVPSRRRMEGWSRRLAASRIDTLPPPGFLD